MGTGQRSFTVRFHHPAQEVFDYLSDPAARPRWQSSMRRVVPLTEQRTGVGARWRDVIVGGIAPEMEVLAHRVPEEWAEVGRWRGLSMYLALTFLPRGPETEVAVRVSLTGRGPWRLPAAVGAWVTPAALRSDLRRADRQLGSGGGGPTLPGVLLVALVLLLGGCADPPDEAAPGDSAAQDQGGTVGGSGLPAGFPVGEVPVVDGDVVAALGSAGEGWSVTVQVAGDARAVLDDAVSRLAAAGFVARADSGALGPLTASLESDTWTVVLLASAVDEADTLNYVVSRK